MDYSIDRFRLDQKPPSPFSLTMQQVKSTYQNVKYILKRNRSI